MIEAALCDAFCSEVRVTPIPVGFAVRAPHIRRSGDFVSFYLRRHPELDDHFRVEDDGCTVADLEAAGLDLDKESRFEAFVDLLAQHDARYSEKEVLISTDYMPLHQATKAAVSFSYLSARLEDLLLLVESRVQRSFKEDLAELIDQQFGQECQISRNAPIDREHADYIVDFVIRAPTGQVLAVFAGSSELKALESLLFWEQVKSGDYASLRSMIVLEETKPKAIKDRTLSRVMNSGLVLATLEGGMLNVGEKIRRTLAR